MLSNKPGICADVPSLLSLIGWALLSGIVMAGAFGLLLLLSSLVGGLPVLLSIVMCSVMGLWVVKKAQGEAPFARIVGYLFAALLWSIAVLMTGVVL